MSRPIRAAFAVIALAVVLALGGACSGGPSDGHIEAAVRQMHDLDVADPVAALRSIERVDGRMEDDNSYVAIVSYELEYLKSSDDIAVALGKRASEEGDQNPFAGFKVAIGLLTTTLAPFKKGDRREFKRTFTLKKWESGWRVEGAK